MISVGCVEKCLIYSWHGKNHATPTRLAVTVSEGSVTMWKDVAVDDDPGDHVLLLSARLSRYVVGGEVGECGCDTCGRQ